MKLYELSEQYQQLQDLSADDEGMEIAIRDTLEGITGEFREKAVNLVKFTQNMDADIESLDAEIKRLQSRKKAMTNKKQALREYLRENMERTGISKIECPLFTITCSKGAEAVEIDDGTELPDEYIKTEYTVRRAELKSALKAGEHIDGARLVPGKSSIRIK